MKNKIMILGISILQLSGLQLRANEGHLLETSVKKEVKISFALFAAAAASATISRKFGLKAPYKSFMVGFLARGGQFLTSGVGVIGTYYALDGLSAPDKKKSLESFNRLKRIVTAADATGELALSIELDTLMNEFEYQRELTDKQKAEVFIQAMVEAEYLGYDIVELADFDLNKIEESLKAKSVRELVVGILGENSSEKNIRFLTRYVAMSMLSAIETKEQN